VITALFGPFELDASYPGKGLAYIANISDRTNCTWDDVLENLRELVEELGLSLPEDAEDNIEENLYVLASHFGADGNYELGNLIEHSQFDDEADLESLFTIARAFDDGHGLKSYQTESSWHCSKPRLGEFGGAGAFAGVQCAVSGASNHITDLGERLESALVGDDVEEAATILYKNFGDILAGVHDEKKREAIRLKLSEQFAASASQALDSKNQSV
jgi:hypothetical protein